MNEIHDTIPPPHQRRIVMGVKRTIDVKPIDPYGFYEPVGILMGGTADRRDNVPSGQSVTYSGAGAIGALLSVVRSEQIAQAGTVVREVGISAASGSGLSGPPERPAFELPAGVVPLRPTPVPEALVALPQTGRVVFVQNDMMAPDMAIGGALPGVYPDPNNPGRYVINAGGLQSENLSLEVANRIADVTAGTINPPIVQTGSGGGEVATDWGDALGNLAIGIAQAKYGQPVQAQPAFLPALGAAVPYVGSALGLGAAASVAGEVLGMDPSAGLGLPGVDIVRTDDFTKGKMYNPRTGKWVRCCRRRRKLLTDSDFKCLATLKTLTGNSAAFTAAVVRAVR